MSVELKQRYTFSKDEKLKSRKAIEQLFATGRSFSNFPFKVVWKGTENTVTGSQAGFTVSSKQFKKAVDRNRIKRLIREAYRLQKHELQQQLKSSNKSLAVFFIYVGNELPDYTFIFEKTGKAIKHLIRLINENNLADT